MSFALVGGSRSGAADAGGLSNGFAAACAGADLEVDAEDAPPVTKGRASSNDRRGWAAPLSFGTRDLDADARVCISTKARNPGACALGVIDMAQYVEVLVLDGWLAGCRRASKRA